MRIHSHKHDVMTGIHSHEHNTMMISQYLSSMKALKNLHSREKTIVRVNTDVVHVTKHAKWEPI